jgi:hypothetical protein
VSQRITKENRKDKEEELHPTNQIAQMAIEVGAVTPLAVSC